MDWDTQKQKQANDGYSCRFHFFSVMNAGKALGSVIEINKNP